MVLRLWCGSGGAEHEGKEAESEVLSREVAEQYVTLGRELIQTGKRASDAENYDAALQRHVIYA